MKTWAHDELAEDLGDTKQTNFLNVHLGSPFLQDSVQRADVMEIKPSYTRFCVSVYEVKISRSDFQSDIRSGKWRGYLEHCHRFYFAVPAGMVTKDEIPEEAGLIVRGQNGWKVLKPSKPRDIQIPYMTMMSLMFVRQRTNFQDLKRKKIYDIQRWYHKRNELYKALGKDIGDALRNRDYYLQQSQLCDEKIRRIDKLINDGLGKNDEDSWPECDLRNLVRRIKEKAERMSA